MWSLLSTYDGDAASPGAQRRYILNPRCSGAGAMKPASGIPGRADTHSGIQSWPAPRISTPACANLAKDGKSSVGSQRRVCTSSRSLLSAFALSSFFFCQAASSANVEARRTVSTDERMSPSARPFKIARLTGEMPRSAVFGSSALIILTEDKAAHEVRGGALSNVGSGPEAEHPPPPTSERTARR